MSDKERLAALGRLIAEQMGKAPDRPKLRLVGKVDLPKLRCLQPFERDMRYQLVRDTARLHGLQWLIRRETEHVDGVIEQLDDSGLLALHATMRRAEACILEGIGFDDAGLM